MNNEPAVGYTVATLCFPVSLRKNFKNGVLGVDTKFSFGFILLKPAKFCCDLSGTEMLLPHMASEWHIVHLCCIRRKDQHFLASCSWWLNFQQKGKI